MSGDLVWTKGFARKPEVAAIAARCGVPRAEAAVALMEFREWAEPLADAAGRLPGFTLAALAAHQPEAPAGFFPAVAAVGWLDVDGEGVGLGKVMRQFRQDARKRARAAERQRRFRVNHPKPPKQPRFCDRRDKKRYSVTEVTPVTENGESGQAGQNGKQRKPRARDLLFDAIAAVTGSDPRASGSFIGKVRAALASAEPPYTPEEVRLFPAVWAAAGMGVPVTLGVLSKHIGWVRNPPGGTNGRSVGRRAGRVEAPEGKYNRFRAPEAPAAPGRAQEGLAPRETPLFGPDPGDVPGRDP